MKLELIWTSIFNEIGCDITFFWGKETTETIELEITINENKYKLNVNIDNLDNEIDYFLDKLYKQYIRIDKIKSILG